MVRPLIALAACTLVAVGCGDPSSYELSWTIGCAKAGDPSCTISSARDCASFGVDAIAVRAFSGESDEGVVRFPCYDEERGASGRGPDLPGGSVRLEVSALTAGGQSIAGPVNVEVKIPDTGYTAASVNIPAPIQCADGADNDGDGLVDLLDPGCKDAKDPVEGDADSPDGGTAGDGSTSADGGAGGDSGAAADGGGAG